MSYIYVDVIGVVVVGVTTIHIRHEACEESQCQHDEHEYAVKVFTAHNATPLFDYVVCSLSPYAELVKLVAKLPEPLM